MLELHIILIYDALSSEKYTFISFSRLGLLLKIEREIISKKVLHCISKLDEQASY